MSSETPADRPTDSPDASGGGRPRRALQPGEAAVVEQPDRPPHSDAADSNTSDSNTSDSNTSDSNTSDSDAPGSPSTPVRFHDRLAARARRAEVGDPRWSWELPDTEEPDDTPDQTTDHGPAQRPDHRSYRPSYDQSNDTASEAAGDHPVDDPVDRAVHRPKDEAAAQAREQPDDEPADQPSESSQPGQLSGASAWIAAAQPPAGNRATQSQTTENQTTETQAQFADAESEPEPVLGPDGKPLPMPTGFGTPSKPTRKPARKAAKRRPGGKAALGGKQRFKLLQGMTPRAPREEIPDQSHLPAQQRTDLAVRVTDLSVTYRTSFEKKPTFRQAVMRLGRGQRAVREIKALQDISFEVKTGSSVGIIGRNGAGKSTLMRTLSGILPPTSGTVEVWGRASTLLALGVNFNHSLSGRENIILGALAAGLSKDEAVERAGEIADWTELGDFIDMPMRTYSSGMAARISFAIAVHMEPDILMIDEGLSTGDAHFKDKASAKMTELRDKARAMFLVSHGLGSITELCDQAIWIDKGRLIARGEPAEVVDKYLSTLRADRKARKASDFEDV
ncbi:hypothetical protein GCM10011575_32000 [Microlunatus endophyticus]|uniref:ABC transporter domain-containing protein n=1 Tax=Microlunatus endophyticus TaxID=1716077 RepID=A0A917SCZ3_9ACTN|nr:ABC transporter ATP-binding protein [Microlunatus endophyticus]GGL71155.1 hypothetical protein GCM10011575_32000 [Microlunatus endophyticus]